MKNITIPQQPKNRDDEMYRVIAEYLNDGDQKVFAIELGVTPTAISKVVNGAIRSKRIWTHLMKVVLKRREQKLVFMQYMTTTV